MNPEPHLFRPLALRSVTTKNRIMLSPMCQYSAIDGEMNDWHFMHLAARAAGGSGIIFTEATHVEARGRITNHCLGIWNDAQRDRAARVADFVSAQNAVPAMQIAHAGRKASCRRPWEGSKPLSPTEGAWEVIAPSAIPFAEDSPLPSAMTKETIDHTSGLFAAAARRAREAGFRILEIHAAHGYLIHEFLSPIANHREDDYGGSFENRARFLLQTVAAVRTEWPAHLPLFARLSCTDWVDGGWTLEDSVRLSAMLKATGSVDLIDCSSGAIAPRVRVPVHPGYQIPFAAEIKRRTGLLTGAVGLIHSADFAESILANGQADLVILGRTLLADPVWPLRAAAQLKASSVKWPVQYERGNVF